MKKLMQKFFKQKFFKKKTKKEQLDDKEENGVFKNSENKLMQGSSYLVTVKEQVSDSGILRKVSAPFVASRFRDEDTNMTFLYCEDKKSKKVGFMELFPERKEELAKLDPKKIKQKLSKDLALLAKIEREPDKVRVNRNDVEFSIMKCKAQLSASKWGQCSFLEFGAKGEKEFTFLRQGTNFVPIGFDPDRNIYGIPSDIAKKSAWTWLRNKETKHSKYKGILLKGTISIFAVALIMFVASVFILFKSYGLYGQNPVNEAYQLSLQTATDCGQQNLNNAKQFTEFLENLNQNLQQPTTTVIQGLQPTSFNQN